MVKRHDYGHTFAMHQTKHSSEMFEKVDQNIRRIAMSDMLCQNKSHTVTSR